jgi:hypothetical protein
LPLLTAKTNTLMATGKTKDADPVSLFQKSVPQIVAKSVVPQINDILGGGYRDGMLVVYAGITGHGKSTILITHACDLALQKKRVSVIVNELMPELFFKRVLRGCSRLTEGEIERKKGNTPERDEALKSWLAFLQQYVRVYDSEFYSPKWMDRVCSWDDSEALIVDYIKEVSGGGRSQGVDQPGDMAFAMLDLYRGRRIPILSAGQMSDANAKAFLKNDSAPAPIIYGSARVQQATTVYVAMKKDNLFQNMGYFHRHKDSYSSTTDAGVRIPYDPNANTFTIPVPQGVQHL